MIDYKTSVEGITKDTLNGFFVGWQKKPIPEKHLELLKNSDYVVIAVEGDRVVGFITAISDKVLAAYIPLLEVLPEYQSKGIGSELVKRMMALLSDFYMIDLLCDPELQSFYEKLGMEKATGMRIRSFNRLS